MASAPNTGISTYRHLVFENANFRNVWFGEIVSNFGDWFNLVASASLITELSGTKSAIGAMFFVRMMAPFLVSPIAGVIADLYPRKAIMIVSDLSRAATVACFLVVRSSDQLWILYTVTAVQLAIGGFFVPARNAILPDLVPRKDLGVANALSSGTFAVMLAFGAAVGGVVASLVGVYDTFLIDVVSYVVSAALIFQIDAPKEIHSQGKSISSMLNQYVDGWRYLRGDKESLLLALQKGLNALFITGGLNVLMVAVALSRFSPGRGGSFGIGLTFCATGVGTALGPILARRFTRDREEALRQGLVVCYVISALGLLLIPTQETAFVLSGFVIRGLGGGMMFVFSTQLLMLRLPGAMRGRVFSFEYAFRTLASAIGTLWVSMLLDTTLGLQGTIWCMAAMALIPGGIWFLWLSLVRVVETKPASPGP